MNTIVIRVGNFITELAQLERVNSELKQRCYEFPKFHVLDKKKLKCIILVYVS
jgi:hypothetical protein